MTLKYRPDEGFCTPEGLRLLEESEELQRVVTAFMENARPEECVGEGRPYQSGKYGRVWKISGVAIKVSSPTSTFEKNGRRLPPECLMCQFDFMKKLGDVLEIRDTSIIVPKQFFAIESSYQAFLLCQEYMDGWITLTEWISKFYEGKDKSTFWPVVANFVSTIRHRILRAVEGTSIANGLSDLYLHQEQIHGTNILVPVDAQLEGTPRLCILDQVGDI